MQKPEDFIKWSAISRHFANDRSSVTRTRQGPHAKKIKELMDFIEQWKSKPD